MQTIDGQINTGEGNQELHIELDDEGQIVQDRCFPTGLSNDIREEIKLAILKRGLYNKPPVELLMTRGKKTGPNVVKIGEIRVSEITQGQV